GEGRREGGGSRGKKGAVREEGQSSPPPPMIRDDIRIIWACSESAMNGSASSSVTKIARIFGTNTSVCSWIWVSAWNSETTTPTTRPTIISGEDTTTMVQIASRATSRVSGPVILSSSKFTTVIPGRAIARTRNLEIPVLVLADNPGMTAYQSPRHCEERERRSNPDWSWGAGLLRGACHRATLRVDPLTRNDETAIPSDRHLHDVFVGLDDAVAHRDQR